jgi:hypothetical protein
VLALVVQLRSRWRAHWPGQVDFVTFNAAEGLRPVTITSDWRNDGALRWRSC